MWRHNRSSIGNRRREATVNDRFTIDKSTWPQQPASVIMVYGREELDYLQTKGHNASHRTWPAPSSTPTIQFEFLGPNLRGTYPHGMPILNWPHQHYKQTTALRYIASLNFKLTLKKDIQVQVTFTLIGLLKKLSYLYHFSFLLCSLSTCRPIHLHNKFVLLFCQ